MAKTIKKNRIYKDSKKVGDKTKKIKNFHPTRFINIIDNIFRIYSWLKRSWLEVISKWLPKKEKKKKLRGRKKESRWIYTNINTTFPNDRSWPRFWLRCNRTKKHWEHLFHELNSLMLICNCPPDSIFPNKKRLFQRCLADQMST